MCLKYGQFQPKRAYKARAYKKKCMLERYLSFKLNAHYVFELKACVTSPILDTMGTWTPIFCKF